jgi:hypothetical protein
MLHACGQLLWKNLWKMWKTMSFQQVCKGFACGEPLHSLVHKPVGYRNVMGLCIRRNRCAYGENLAEKFGI